MSEDNTKNCSKALVPVSMSTRGFSTKRLRRVLPAILQKNEEIIFLIADRLQMYNDAANKWPNRPIKEIVNWQEFPRSYFPQRERWLKRVYNTCGRKLCSSARFLSMDDVCDGHCFIVLRNLNILFDINEAFRTDICNEVYKHLAKRESYGDFDRSVRLSTHYLLEEIAANIRLRVVENIQNEYYLGEQIAVLPQLYAGQYGANVYDLAGIAQRAVCFAFYEWKEEEGSGTWVSVESPSAPRFEGYAQRQ
jgi:hypothetical protein